MSFDSLRGVDVTLGLLALVYGAVFAAMLLGYAFDPLDVVLVGCSGLSLLCSVVARRHGRTDVGLAGHGFATVAGAAWALQRPEALLSHAVVSLLVFAFFVQTYNVATGSTVLRWDA